MLTPLMANRVLLEQYLDFVHGRRFRQTLLCHSNLNPSLVRERIDELYLSCEARPVDPPADLATDDVLMFQGKKRSAFRCEHPLTKAVLCELAAIHPERRPYRDALEAGAKRLGFAGPVDGADEERLRSFITRLYAPSLIELHALPLPYSVSPGEKPTASPFAAWMLRQGADHVVSLRGTFVEVGGRLGRFLFGLLDGRRDRASLLEAVRKFLREQPATETKGEGDDERLPLPDDPDLPLQLERALTGLARLGVLIDRPPDEAHP
jgi:hypothetical protein